MKKVLKITDLKTHFLRVKTGLSISPAIHARVVDEQDNDTIGKIPMAQIKATPDATETEKDLLKYLQVEGVDKGKIAKWMLPVYVALVDDIPKTSVGKYNKIAVRDNMEEYIAKAKRVRLT